MLLLSAAIALACSTTPPDPGPIGSVHEGPGLYMLPGTLGELHLDGTVVPHDVVVFEGPNGAALGEVWLPDAPLVEGQAWTWRPLAGTDVAGTVKAAYPTEDAEILAVAHGDRERGGGGSCLSSGKYRQVGAELGMGRGAMLLRDVDTDVVWAGPLSHSYVTYVRDGFARRETCLEAEWLAVDGTVHLSDVVCSTDRGCSTGGSGPVGLWAMAGFGLLLRRRTTR